MKKNEWNLNLQLNELSITKQTIPAAISLVKIP